MKKKEHWFQSYPTTEHAVNRLKREGCRGVKDLFVNQAFYIKTDKHLAIIRTATLRIRDGCKGLCFQLKIPREVPISFVIIIVQNRHYVIPVQSLPRWVCIPFNGNSKYNKYIENWSLMI